MKKKYVMGIDVGGTAIKAVIFDEKGVTIDVASTETPLSVPQPGFNERDMGVLWDKTAQVIKEVIQHSGVEKEDILSVGCTGHGKGLYLWGKEDAPAYKGIASTDQRAKGYITKWEEEGTIDRVIAKTLQKPIPCQPVALLAWLKDEEPQVYENIEWVFEAKDFIRFMLTGIAMAEVTDYSGTSLMNLSTCDFDVDILKAYGIEEVWDKLPPLTYAHELCGSVTAKAAKETGLMEGTPLCGGMFDIDACGIAMHMTEPEALSVITGTWSINEYISTNPVSGQATTLNSLYCIPGYYLIEESSATSAGNLEWLLHMIDLGDIPTDMDTYTYVNTLVETCKEPMNNVIFLPFLYGSNSSRTLEAAFLGLTQSTEKGTLLHAVFEGVAFSHYMHIKRLLNLRDAPKTIRIAGGATKSQPWLQIFADVIGIPLEVIEAEELGAMGAAMAASIACGLYHSYDHAAQQMVRVKRKIYPDSRMHDFYEKKFATYQKTIKALESIQE